MDLDDTPKKKFSAIEDLETEKLDNLSVDELQERIKILKREIARTEAELQEKDASKQAAEDIFKT